MNLGKALGFDESRKTKALVLCHRAIEQHGFLLLWFSKILSQILLELIYVKMHIEIIGCVLIGFGNCDVLDVSHLIEGGDFKEAVFGHKRFVPHQICWLCLTYAIIATTSPLVKYFSANAESSGVGIDFARSRVIELMPAKGT